MILKNIIEAIGKLEKDTFSDGWSVDSIGDTLNHNYNIVYVAYKDENAFKLYRFQNGQDIWLYSRQDGKDWNITIVDSQEANIISGSFVGYIIANLIGDETELLRIAVTDMYRGQGIGRTLLDFYLNDVADECNRCFLEVRASNQSARGLYEKYGYQEIALRKSYYSNPTEDGIIYECNL